MTANVRLFVDQKDSVLKVPNSALRTQRDVDGRSAGDVRHLACDRLVAEARDTHRLVADRNRAELIATLVIRHRPDAQRGDRDRCAGDRLA